MNKKLRLLSVLVAFCTSQLFAQTADYKWAVGLNFGYSEYNGDLGNGFFKFDFLQKRILTTNGMGIRNTNPGIYGLTVSKYQSRFFDFAGQFYMGEWGHFTTTYQSFYTRFGSLDANARFKFLGKENSRITPYITVGLGGRYVKVDEPNDFGKSSYTEVTIPAGLGLNIKCEERVYLNIQSQFGWTNNDQAEGSVKLQHYTWDQYLNHTVGLNILLGKMKDADGDGVSDKKDLCPNTPAGALVDKTGCIIDGDKDGIADNLDKCPTVAGVAKFNGCPDSDNDGIEDANDKCPTIAGLEKFAGCPDTDGDGIEDAKDKCPNVKGIEKFEGCPDTDGDGIEDAKDECPNKAGTAAFNGCPDTDGDGIADNKDKCPKVAGVASNNGCPEVKAAVKKIFEKALQGIQFETGKTTIKKTSNPILDQVAKIMKENPTYKLAIAGHTDNVGNADKNLELSKGRAAAVKQYLVSKGVSADRMTSEGYGDTQPVADNTTTEGKAKNRRVEFKVVFEDFE